MTTKTTYTPGPWTVQYNPTYKTWDIEGPLKTNNSFRRKEDAMLCASAPDLLYAAKEALDALDGSERSYAVRLLRAAIADAESDSEPGAQVRK